jgi:hypothetical protein
MLRPLAHENVVSPANKESLKVTSPRAPAAIEEVLLPKIVALLISVFTVVPMVTPVPFLHELTLLTVKNTLGIVTVELLKVIPLEELEWAVNLSIVILTAVGVVIVIVELKHPDTDKSDIVTPEAIELIVSPPLLVFPLLTTVLF